jgi:Prolyl oligopeptidase, N-terminal beta-propeller domain
LAIPALLLAINLQAEPSSPLQEQSKQSAEGKAQGGLKPPVARVEIVRDTYFGETVEDPYRWMENDKDPGWLPFLKAENDYTRKVLDKVPGRDALLKRIEQLSGDTVQTNRLQRAHGNCFFSNGRSARTISSCSCGRTRSTSSGQAVATGRSNRDGQLDS